MKYWDWASKVSKRDDGETRKLLKSHCKLALTFDVTELHIKSRRSTGIRQFQRLISSTVEKAYVDIDSHTAIMILFV